jgi:hypothetical protein
MYWNPVDVEGGGRREVGYGIGEGIVSLTKQ